MFLVQADLFLAFLELSYYFSEYNIIKTNRTSSQYVKISFKLWLTGTILLSE